MNNTKTGEIVNNVEILASHSDLFDAIGTNTLTS